MTRFLLFLLFGCLPLAAQGTVHLSIGLTYDSLGRIETITHPGTGKVQRFTYNALNDHLTVTYDGQTIVSETDYWLSGFPGSIKVNAHGGMPEVTVTRAYDVLYRLTEIQISAGGTTRYRAHDMSYNAWGFIQSVDRTDPGLDATLTYGYGDLGQLSSFAVSGVGTTSYAYDGNGNLTGRTALNGNGLQLPAMTGVTYDAATNRRDGWSYDVDGNLIEDDRYRYRYNALGRLTDIFRRGRPDPMVSYLYDGFGHRVRETNSDGVIYSARLTDGRLITQEFHRPLLGGGWEITRKDYIYHNGFPLLTVTHHPDGGTSRQYRFADRLGNAAVVVDQASGYQWTYREYAPYGYQMTAADAGVVTHEFTGHERDVSGHDYMLARYYHWEVGRFNRPDPGFDWDAINPMSFNLYQYGRNNPVNGHDPNGRVWANLAGGVLGGAIDLGIQLASNGGSFREVNYWSVGASFGLGLANPVAGLEKAIAQNAGREALELLGKAAARETLEAVVPFPTDVWKRAPLKRGIEIENYLAKTDYKDWYHVGKERNGFFPLVDFQRGNTLVSLKTTDPSSPSAIKRMKDHIDDLAESNAKIDGRLADLELDIRVPRGTSGALKGLKRFGSKKGVEVNIREF